MYRGDLHNHRLFIPGGFLQGIDQLPQIFNGIDIVMGSRRNGIGAFRNHAGSGDITDDFRTGQMAADARLRALTHLDLHSGAGFQVIFMNTETAGCHLNNGIRSINIEVLMQAAFAGVIVNAKLCGGPCQTLVGIIADGTVAHG